LLFFFVSGNMKRMLSDAVSACARLHSGFRATAANSRERDRAEKAEAELSRSN
jgi:hypothetical protein